MQHHRLFGAERQSEWLAAERLAGSVKQAGCEFIWKMRAYAV
jgi:hypothetical protein